LVNGKRVDVSQQKQRYHYQPAKNLDDSPEYSQYLLSQTVLKGKLMLKLVVYLNVIITNNIFVPGREPADSSADKF